MSGIVLTRNDVAAIAACVSGCDGGTGAFDPLLEKLRALWTMCEAPLRLPEVSPLRKEGPMRGAGESPVGESRVAVDHAPASAGGGKGFCPSGSLPAEAGYPTVRELEYEPGAPDTVIADETAVESFARPDARASTVAAVKAGVENAEREEVIEERRRSRVVVVRRRRTRAVNE